MEKTSIIKNTKILYEKYGENITPEILSQQANISLEYAENYIYLRRRGFNTMGKYFNYLKKKHKKKNKISIAKSPDYIYKRRGFDSKQEYEKDLENKRQQNPINKKFSSLITTRFNSIYDNRYRGKNKAWLARELGVTQSAVSRFFSGKTLPRGSLQLKLFKLLKLPYKTLDDFITSQTDEPI